MTQEKLEEIAIKNAESIAALTVIASNTSQDVDKLVKHMDDALPLHAKVSNLERRTGILESRWWKVISAGIALMLVIIGDLLVQLVNLLGK